MQKLKISETPLTNGAEKTPKKSLLYLLPLTLFQGIVTESKSGRRAILADRVVDATGDADIAYFANCDYRKTPKHEAMGLTTVFNAAGVDKEKFLDYVAKNKATYKDWSRTWDQVRKFV